VVVGAPPRGNLQRSPRPLAMRERLRAGKGKMGRKGEKGKVRDGKGKRGEKVRAQPPRGGTGEVKEWVGKVG